MLAQTAARPENFASRKASGSWNTSWRVALITRLISPSPSAWNTLDMTMPTAAGKNESAMMRNAGSPMACMAGEALNSPSRGPAPSSNTRVPAAIMASAITVATRTASVMRCFLRAP